MSLLIAFAYDHVLHSFSEKRQNHGQNQNNQRFFSRGPYRASMRKLLYALDKAGASRGRLSFSPMLVALVLQLSTNRIAGLGLGMRGCAR